MNYKLICIDMDGTLFNSEKIISGRNKSALIAASGKGVKVVLTSGRLYSFALAYADYTDQNNVIISSNGAYIRETSTNKVLLNKVLSLEQTKNILRIFKKYNIPVIFTSPDSIFIDYNSFMLDHYINFNQKFSSKYRINIEIMHTLEQWETALNRNSDVILKAMVLNDGYERMDLAKEELSLMENITLTSAQPRSIEVNAAGVSKGDAVEFIADYYNIQRKDIICIGDGENDISMIKYAGLGIAMGNAPDIVKKASDYVTDTNENDGVAKAIEKFII